MSLFIQISLNELNRRTQCQNKRYLNNVKKSSINVSSELEMFLRAPCQKKSSLETCKSKYNFYCNCFFFLWKELFICIFQIEHWNVFLANAVTNIYKKNKIKTSASGVCVCLLGSRLQLISTCIVRFIVGEESANNSSGGSSLEVSREQKDLMSRKAKDNGTVTSSIGV